MSKRSVVSCLTRPFAPRVSLLFLLSPASQRSSSIVSPVRQSCRPRANRAVAMSSQSSSRAAFRSRSPIGRRRRSGWVSFTARCPDGQVCGKKGATLGTFETVSMHAIISTSLYNFITHWFTNVFQIGGWGEPQPGNCFVSFARTHAHLCQQRKICYLCSFVLFVSA